MKTKPKLFYILPLTSYILSCILPLVSCENETIVRERLVDDPYTVEVPYGTRIESVVDFVKIGVDEEWPLSGEYYLAEDIDLSEVITDETPWLPIGTDGDNPFTGVLHGNSKKITGLKLPGGDAQYTGLFGYLNGAYIHDLTVECVNKADEVIELELRDAANSKDKYIGLLAAYAKSAKLHRITGSEIKLNVESPESSTGILYLGGLLGYCENTELKWSNADIKISGKNKDSAGALYCGGIAGRVKCGTLSGLEVRGSIDAIVVIQSKNHYIGGIAGYVESAPLLYIPVLFENNISEISSITVNSETPLPALWAGGLIAWASTTYVTIKNCFVNSDMNLSITTPVGDSTSPFNAGGILGVGGTLSNCGINGKLTMTVIFGGKSAVYAGGLAGQADIEKSYISNSESLITVTRNYQGSSTTGTNIGGLTGKGSVSNSYSFCNVRHETSYTSTSSTASNWISTGGLTGHLAASKTINSSYTKGRVEIIDTYSGNNGKVYLGGISGYANNNSTSRIENCAALNQALLITTSTNPVKYNRIVPDKISSNLTNNVAKIGGALPAGDNITQSGGDTGSATVGDGAAVTTIDEDLFKITLGWDFDTIWKWDSALGLPVLK